MPVAVHLQEDMERVDICTEIAPVTVVEGTYTKSLAVWFARVWTAEMAS